MSKISSAISNNPMTQAISGKLKRMVVTKRPSNSSKMSMTSNGQAMLSKLRTGVSTKFKGEQVSQMV